MYGLGVVMEIANVHSLSLLLCLSLSLLLGLSLSHITKYQVIFFLHGFILVLFFVVLRIRKRQKRKENKKMQIKR